MLPPADADGCTVFIGHRTHKTAKTRPSVVPGGTGLYTDLRAVGRKHRSAYSPVPPGHLPHSAGFHPALQIFET